jgi:rhodanese-related sulfurtransferase
MKNVTVFISVVIYLICVSINCFATTYYVYAGAPFETIQDAIDLATHGDTVLAYPGIYYENIFFNGKNIVLTSMDPDSPSIVAATIIDGSMPDNPDSGSVVTFAGSETTTCVLTGFTIKNGTGTRYTDMIDIYYRGGGIYGNYCYATIQNNIITENSANGYYGSGGGLFSCRGTIQNNIITGNSADLAGGGLSNCHGIIQNNLITDNEGIQSGGGLYWCNGTIQNNTISGNLANWAGGLDDCSGTIQNNTISENSAAESCGGLNWCNGTITNCIIWGNTAPDGPQLYNSVTPTYSCIQDWSGGGEGNTNSNPLFVNAAGGDYRLQSGSPCIDSGYQFADAGEYDLDGNPRYVDAWDSSGWDGAIKAMVIDDGGTVHLAWASIDMGAYEYQTACTPLEFTLQSLDDLDSGSWRERYTGFAGAWTDTEAVGLGKRFYRVIGDYAVEQSIVGIFASDALAMLNERFGDDCFTVIDVRTAGEYATQHIIGAVNIDYYSPTFADQLNALDKGRTYLVHCASGFRSSYAVQTMEALGFVEVYDLLGGMSAFQSVPGADAYLEP